MAIDDRQQWSRFPYGEEPRRYQQFGQGYAYDPWYRQFRQGYAYDPFGFGDRYERFGLGYPSERFGYADERFGYEPGYGGLGFRHQHTWRGGILGWLGAGIRAGAGWFGNQLQQWGSWFGGRVSGGTAEIGRAVRGRGERVASALEEQDERTASTFGARRSRPPRYRRPDERILDDVWHRVAISAADPQDVEIEVNGGVVTLSGRVDTRFEKRLIEDIADGVFGVQEVHNHLRIAPGSPDLRAAGADLHANAGASASQRRFDEAAGQPERH
jgi:hypothetical protein